MSQSRPPIIFGGVTAMWLRRKIHRSVLGYSKHLPLALAVCWALISSPSAGENAFSVRVDCTELDLEERAAIEARQLSELRTRGTSIGTLSLSCSDSHVEGQWDDGQAIYQRRISRQPDDDVKELLHWLASMLLELRAEEPPAEGQRTSPEEPPEGPPEVEQLGVETTVPNEQEEAHQVERENAVRETRVEPIPVAQPARARPKPPPPITWEAQGSGLLRYWGGSLTGAAGPRISLGPQFIQGYGGAVSFSPQWGLRKADGFKVREYLIAADVSWQPVDMARASLGPRLSFLQVALPSDAEGGNRASTSWGLGALVQFQQDMGRMYLTLGLGLDWFVRKREILLNQETVAKVPALQAGLTLGLAAALRRNPKARDRSTLADLMSRAPEGGPTQGGDR